MDEWQWYAETGRVYEIANCQPIWANQHIKDHLQVLGRLGGREITWTSIMICSDGSIGWLLQRMSDSDMLKQAGSMRLLNCQPIWAQEHLKDLQLLTRLGDREITWTSIMICFHWGHGLLLSNQGCVIFNQSAKCNLEHIFIHNCWTWLLVDCVKAESCFTYRQTNK
jgi:hypothetical protein